MVTRQEHNIIIHNYANHADPCYYHAHAHATDAAYGAAVFLINSMCTNCNCVHCILIEKSLHDSLLHVDVTLHGVYSLTKCPHILKYCSDALCLNSSASLVLHVPPSM